VAAVKKFCLQAPSKDGQRRSWLQFQLHLVTVHESVSSRMLWYNSVETCLCVNKLLTAQSHHWAVTVYYLAWCDRLLLPVVPRRAVGPGAGRGMHGWREQTVLVRVKPDNERQAGE